jgi:hypothetical protein
MNLEYDKEIGGFFQLELNKNKIYHSKAIALNSGRSCLEYIIQVKNPKKIYIPIYSCDSILIPIKSAGVDYAYYRIDEEFRPIMEQDLGDDEFILYINYFGLNNYICLELSTRYENLIIDNTQAFYAKPIKSVPTFYSPRKFFGVSDGGYLYIENGDSTQLEVDVSYDNYIHLLKRIDISASESYKLYAKSEELFDNRSMKQMSNLTYAVLCNIDYEKAKLIRERNFLYVHSELSKINELDVKLEQINGPMVYPFFSSKKGIREELIRNKVYVATYWKEVLSRSSSSDVENKFTNSIIPIPIDQRYDLEDMRHIISIIGKMN